MFARIIKKIQNVVALIFVNYDFDLTIKSVDRYVTKGKIKS